MAEEIPGLIEDLNIARDTIANFDIYSIDIETFDSNSQQLTKEPGEFCLSLLGDQVSERVKNIWASYKTYETSIIEYNAGIEFGYTNKTEKAKAMNKIAVNLNYEALLADFCSEMVFPEEEVEHVKGFITDLKHLGSKVVARYLTMALEPKKEFNPKDFDEI